MNANKVATVKLKLSTTKRVVLSFMFEFYNGALERVLFSSPDWSIGTLDNSIKAKELALTSKTYQTSEGSAVAKNIQNLKIVTLSLCILIIQKSGVQWDRV